MLLSAVSCVSPAFLAPARPDGVCAVLRGSKRAGLPLGLLMSKKSKKRNPT